MQANVLVCVRARVWKLTALKKTSLPVQGQAIKMWPPFLGVEIFYVHLSFHLTFSPQSWEKLLAYFQRTSLVIHLLSRLRGTKADPRRYEKWPELGECHSGRRIILAFLKKKTQGKFAFDEFNKSKAATEEIFS